VFKYLFAFIVFILLIYISLRDKVYNNQIILFGASVPQTGIMKAWGSAVYSGASSYFFHVNDNNLLKNKKIQLITYDDKYEPELTKENLNQLIEEDDVFSLFGFVGTPTVKSILPILEKENIPFIAPFTGASFLRDEYKTNIVNYRASYKEEIENLVQYLYKKKKISKIAVFYQNDDYGEEGYISLLEALEKRKLKLNSEGTYKRNTLSIKHAFYEIKKGKPEAIIMVGAYKANALFIKKAKNDPIFKDTIFCNISFGDANEMIKELNYESENLLFSSVVPYYESVNISVINEYKKLMLKYFPKQDLGFVSLESFLAAKAIVQALQNINGSITRTSFLEQLKNLPKGFLNGLPNDYKDTQVQNNLYLYEYKNNSFKEIQ